MTRVPGDRPRLVGDILEYIERVRHWVDKGHAAFANTETGSQATIERQVELIEETANQLGAGFHKLNPEIPWPAIFEIRNDLAHPYQRSYNPERLWRFARDDLPSIGRRLRRARFPPEP